MAGQPFADDSFDLIVGSDVCYDPAMFWPLLATIHHYMRASPATKVRIWMHASIMRSDCQPSHGMHCNAAHQGAVAFEQRSCSCSGNIPDLLPVAKYMSCDAPRIGSGILHSFP
jgi:hypothetical protein